MLKAIFNWRLTLDIFLIATALFLCYHTLRRLGTWKIVVGILIAMAVFVTASVLDLTGMKWIYSNLSHVAVIALIVIFQPELRKIFERAASLRRKETGKGREDLSALVGKAVFALAQQRRGAILVFPGKEPITEWLAGGTALDAEPSFSLIMSVFDPHSAGHDGAMVIQNGRLSCFGMRLPLAKTKTLPEGFGTRHHAAMGLSEVSDAMIVVVSEERGSVTMFHGRRARTVPDKEALSSRIGSHWRDTASYTGLMLKEGKKWRRVPEIGFSLVLAFVFWFTVIMAQTEVRERVFSIPIEYIGTPANIALVGDKATEIKVHLAGPRSDLNGINLAQLAAKVDLANAKPGEQTYAITEENLQLPKGVRLLDSEPSTLVLSLKEIVEKEVIVKPQIARTLVLCFAVAWLTHSMGLSLALGAFLAGLIMSESEYSHQTLSSILPFRDVFTSLFFVSIGMLLDLSFLMQHVAQVILIAPAVMAVKCFLACLAVVVLGFPLRTGVVTGLALCQIGEFSFVLSTAGVTYGLLTNDVYHLFLAVTVLTMGSTPFIMDLAPRLADLALRLPLPGRLRSGFFPVLGTNGANQQGKLRDHLIIVGFGLNGQNLARAARKAGISYVIIEMNPETVRAQKKAGEPIFYGDATYDPVLEHAGVKAARVIVLVISDPAANRRITVMARRLNPKICIISRTRFVPEMIPLYESGADEVIPEEFETSVEIFARVLAKYLIPRDEIERFIAEVRADGYEMFRSLSKNSTSLSDLRLHLPDLEINTFRVSERSPVIGKSLSEIELRKKFGVTVLAIHRDKQILSGPDGNTRLHAGDVLVIIGPPPKLAGIIGLFTGAERWDKT